MDRGETGPAIEEKFAVVITQIPNNRVPEEKAIELLGHYLKPENLALLTEPRVNQEMWLKLKKETQKNDIRFCYIGERLVKELNHDHHSCQRTD